MKRLSARLLALGLVVCSVPSNVYAASPTPIVIVKEDAAEGEDDVNALFEDLKTKRREAQQLVIAQLNNAAVSAQVTALNEAVNTAYAVSASDGIERIRECIKALDDATAALNQALEEMESQGPLQQIKEFLKVHYSFENVADGETSVPNLAKAEGDDSLDGILHEESLKVIDDEMAGKVLQFTSNSNEYLEIPAVMQLDGSYTVGLWVKFDETQMSSTRSNDLILVQPKVTNNNNAGRTHLMVTSENRLATYMDRSTRAAEEALDGFSKWQHMLISYDSEEGKVSLYANGRSIYEETVTKDEVVKDLSDLYIGRHRTQSNGAYPGSFQGYMDEIVVYNTALTAEQVDALYKENANKRSWPDLAAMIAEAEALLEAAELPATVDEAVRLQQVLDWIEGDKIDRDSSYEVIGQYITSMATRIENYQKAAAAPQAPKDLAANADDAKREVTLSWTAADGKVTAYEYSDDNGATWKAAGTGTTFKVTGLEYDKEYSFQVRAKNGEKAGDASNTVKVTLTKPVAEKPATPTGLQVVAGDKEVTVSWTAVTGVTYKVQKNGDSSWTNVTTGSSHKFTGLTNGTEYTFSVKAVKDGQESDAATIKGTPVEATQPEKQTVATPAITPATDTYTEAQDVTITCATQDAKIYYTTDGSAPTASSTLYAGKITVSETTTIKAIAVKDGMNNSEVVSVTITINAEQPGDPDPVETKVAAPAFSLAGGVISSAQNISIDCATEGATIYYTINGSVPSATSEAKKAKSLIYSAPIKVDKTIVIKAVAVKDGLDSSDVVTVKYEIKKPWIFNDVKEDGGWIHKALTYTYNAGGIMAENGNGSGKFDPNTPVTREMFGTVVYRMAGEPGATSKAPFSDMVAGKYYETPVAWAYENGIVKGKGDNKYGVEMPVTRAEIAQMLYNYAVFAGFDTSISNDLSTFTDYKIVSSSSWMETPLSWANAAGMINGKPQDDGSSKLAPNDKATRAECAAMIQRFADKFIK